MSTFSRAFAVATLERAIKTAAQATLSLLGVGVTGLLDVDWAAVASAAGLAAVLSVLSSVASAGFGEPGPSLAGETTEPAPPVAAEAVAAGEPIEVVPAETVSLDTPQSSDIKADAAYHDPTRD